MTERYWVIGGEYADTSFTEIVGDETRLGPFESYDEAVAAWRAKAMETVDDAHARFQIEREGSASYWVVGGVYADTGFDELAPGHEEERLGPFDSYAAALDAWKGRAWATVDDAHARYRIDKV